MRYRPFGGTGWDVSEVGYGMWGMAGWTGSDDEESLASLDRAIELGCNFFDTAWAYGDGHSEQLLGRTLKRHPGHAALHRHQDPAEEPQVAGARRSYALEDVYPRRLHPRIHRAQPARTSASSTHRSAAVPRLERHVGRRRAAGSARSSKLKEEGPGARDRHQHQPLAAGERPAALDTGLDRPRAGRLQRVRPEPGGRALPGVPATRTSR